MQNELRIWGIHTPIQNEPLFLQSGLVAVGWSQMGDLSALPADRDAFRDKYSVIYPDATKGNVGINSGTLYRFVHEMKSGDYIIFPAKSDRNIYIGVIDGDYQFQPGNTEYPHQRQVRWLKHLPRTAFSQGALYEVGSFVTFFSVKNYADEFLAALNKGAKRELPAEDESVGITAAEIKENTKDFILKELVRQLKGHGLEEFIADLLRAMGYRATVSPRGTILGMLRNISTLLPSFAALTVLSLWS